MLPKQINKGKPNRRRARNDETVLSLLEYGIEERIARFKL